MKIETLWRYVSMASSDQCLANRSDAKTVSRDQNF